MIGRLQLGNVNVEATYAMIGIRIPMDVAVGVIERGMGECKKTSEFLSSHYYVTNVKKPTPEEISMYLDEISHGEK